MTTDRWTWTLIGLLGEPWPAPPDLPGRVIEARDEPLQVHYLIGIDDAQELAACMGISRQCAELRLHAYRKSNDPARLLGRASPTAAAIAAAST